MRIILKWKWIHINLINLRVGWQYLELLDRDRVLRWSRRVKVLNRIDRNIKIKWRREVGYLRSSWEKLIDKELMILFRLINRKWESSNLSILLIMLRKILLLLLIWPKLKKIPGRSKFRKEENFQLNLIRKTEILWVKAKRGRNKNLVRGGYKVNLRKWREEVRAKVKCSEVWQSWVLLFTRILNSSFLTLLRAHKVSNRE